MNSTSLLLAPFLLGSFASLATAQQVNQAAGTIFNARHRISFDNPLISPTSPAAHAPLFQNANIASVDLIGTWTSSGDVANSFMDGNCLVSDQGVLTVAEPGDPLDSPSVGAGYDIRFGSPVVEFGVQFIDQGNFSYGVELFSGGALVAAQQFVHSTHAVLWSGPADFDRVRLTFSNTGGVGIDNFVMTPGLERSQGKLTNPSGYLDFDNPSVATGPIASNAPAFLNAGIAFVSTFGTWSVTGDKLTGGFNVFGKSLVVQNGSLAVAGNSAPLDKPEAGAGFDIVFENHVDEFGLRFVDEINFQYEVTAYAGMGKIALTQFDYNGTFPRAADRWRASRSFDRVRIKFLNVLTGVGIDELSLREHCDLTEAPGLPTNTTQLLDFDSPFVPSGVIDSMSTVFHGKGIESASLHGDWFDNGDVLSGNVIQGQGLVSDDNVLRVGGLGDDVDHPMPGAGFDFALMGLATEFGVSFIDQTNFNYEVRFYRGGNELGVGSFTYLPGAPVEPVHWGGCDPFDAVRISFFSGGGVGIDNIAFNVGAAVATYGTAKVNSLGCTPAIGWSGSPSASANSGFVVDCGQVRNGKPGLMFYTVGGARNATPFQCGQLLVGPAGIKRTPAQSAGGNLPPANDCSGSYQIDMNAFAAGLAGGNPSPGLSIAGNQVHCQFWGRDQGFAAPCNTMLSDGLEYLINP